MSTLSSAERVNVEALELASAMASGFGLEVWLSTLLALIAADIEDDSWFGQPRDVDSTTLMICTIIVTSIDWAVVISRQARGSPLAGVVAIESSLIRPLVIALQIPALADYARGVAERLSMFFSERADSDEWDDVRMFRSSRLVTIIFSNWPNRTDIKEEINSWANISPHARERRRSRKDG
jgi:hypothetical protein